MLKQTLYIMTGLPYSGKTTLTKELVKRFGFSVVSMDDIMEEKGLDSATMVQDDWNAVYSEAYEKLKSLLKDGKSVIVDCGNLPVHERETPRNIATSFGITSKLIYINTSKEEILRRWEENQTTKQRGHLEETGLNFAFELFEEPTDKENPIIYNQSMNLDSWIKENI
jgi:predicted kinase